MFLGTYIHSLDIKNRLMIPSKLRSTLGEKIVISKGLDNCLEIRSLVEFERYSTNLNQLSTNKANTRIVIRQLLGNAYENEIDSSGRILLPTNLLTEVKMTKDVVLIGVGTKIEVWDKETFNKKKAEEDEIYSKLAESLED